MNNSGLTYVVLRDTGSGAPWQFGIEYVYNDYNDAIAVIETWFDFIADNSDSFQLTVYSWNNTSYFYNKIAGATVTKEEVVFPNYL